MVLPETERDHVELGRQVVLLFAGGGAALQVRELGSIHPNLSDLGRGIRTIFEELDAKPFIRCDLRCRPGPELVLRIAVKNRVAEPLLGRADHPHAGLHVAEVVVAGPNDEAGVKVSRRSRGDFGAEVGEHARVERVGLGGKGAGLGDHGGALRVGYDLDVHRKLPAVHVNAVERDRRRRRGLVGFPFRGIELSALEIVAQLGALRDAARK